MGFMAAMRKYAGKVVVREIDYICTGHLIKFLKSILWKRKNIPGRPCYKHPTKNISFKAL